MTPFGNLTRLGIRSQVRVHSATPADFRSVMQVVRLVEPQEIYNLSGQSSVGLSFSQPMETMESVLTATQNILETIRFLDPTIRFYNAASSEVFGNTGDTPADEQTPFRPRSPYATAKAAALWAVANYREAYGLHACSGILFNHESPLRATRFVTRKIVMAAARIAAGLETGPLRLGNLDIHRDWGWAPDYVEVIRRMVQADTPGDYVIATGRTWPLREFVRLTFDAFDLDWRDHVSVDEALFRPADIAYSAGDPAKAAVELGWRAETLMPEVVRRMAQTDRDLLAGRRSAPPANAPLPKEA